MTKVLISFLLIFVSFACGKIASITSSEESHNLVAQTTVVQKQTKHCVTFKFHYLETQNVLYSPTVRHIEIFLDEKAFTEENLKTLFVYLSEKNPEPKHLTVIVHTNWAQLQFPSDCPGSGMSNMPERPDKYDYHQAIFYRRGNAEYFRYSPALKVHESEFKTVTIKGNQTSLNE